MVDLNKVLESFPCDDCSLVLSDFKQFLSHRKHHTSSLRNEITKAILLEQTCPLCLGKYSKKRKNKFLAELLGSRESLHEFEVGHFMRCKYYPSCNAEFNRVSEFIKHSKEVHNDSRPYACQQCDYAGARYRNLKQHLFAHVGYKRYRCHLCPKEYTTRKILQSHLLKNHNKRLIKYSDGGYKSICLEEILGLQDTLEDEIKEAQLLHCKYYPKCNAEFKRSKDVHNDDKPYACQKCNYTAKERDDLKVHLLSHVDYKQFKCRLCLKEYASKVGLRDHLLSIHNEIMEKEYKEESQSAQVMISNYCPKCNAEFKDAKEFIKHSKEVHNDDRPYACHLCKYTAKRHEHIKVHLLRHMSYKTFKCHLCLKEYASQEGLRDHLLTIHNEIMEKECKEGTQSGQLMRCKYYPNCNAEFNYESELIAHSKEVHTDDRPFACQECSYTGKQYRYLKQHVCAHVGYKRFKCHLCPKEYCARVSLHNHLLRVHNEVSRESYDCRYCRETFLDSSSLKEHLSKHFPVSPTHTCHICSKQLSSREGLINHFRTHNKKYKCYHCSKCFARKDGLNAHLFTNHAVGKIKLYNCHICSKQLGSSRNLKCHLETHNTLDGRQHDCTECGHAFVCERSLKKHLDPSKESTSTLSCKKCPKTFKNLNCFTYHKRTHREFVCEVCKLKCLGTIKFKAHLETHGIQSDTSTSANQEQSSSSKEIFKCPSCPKEYGSIYRLKEHLRNHDGKEPYVCKSCGKRFVFQHLLKIHHNPEKETKNPLCCKQCPKTFNNVSCFTYHRRSHTRLECEVCKWVCYTRTKLKLHLKTHENPLDIDSGSQTMTSEEESSFKKTLNAHRVLENSAINGH